MKNCEETTQIILNYIVWEVSFTQYLDKGYLTRHGILKNHTIQLREKINEQLNDPLKQSIYTRMLKNSKKWQ